MPWRSVAVLLSASMATACGALDADATGRDSAGDSEESDGAVPDASHRDEEHISDGGNASPSDARVPDSDDDTGPTFAQGPSHCAVTDTTVVCEHEVVAFRGGAVTRNVYYQTPLGEAPAAGWPAVVLYQGSLYGPSVTWGALDASFPHGGFYQGLLQAMLLDNGFTVIAPAAASELAWATNTGTYLVSTDHQFILALLDAILLEGRFGPVDAERLYATGISSGGYMTSRMAVTYPGVFSALAIQAGSYATCSGPVCVVPPSLPADHPPTLFLHGDADTTVPIDTARRYHSALEQGGFETAFLTEVGGEHAWNRDAPVEITDWFMHH